MANSARLPISMLLKDKDNDASINEDPNEPKRKREDWRKQKELEEARKAGQLPALVDESGKDINPHIPQYISSAPWYYGTTGPTLKHQRPQEEKLKEFSGINEWYKRGIDSTKVITKFKKGACENCGSMTHKKKDCMERPRKTLAKFSNSLIAHDEFIQPDLKLDYDGKRDRWAGYDPSGYKEIVEEYEKIEEAKRQLRADKLKANPNESDSSEEDDGDKYADEIDMPGTKVDSKQRITVRNLRIREDTAKYLRNLDPNSAFYDPKTRSMRDNPEPQKNPEETEFAGENFIRYSGDTQKHAQAQLFAWEAHGKGVDVHVLAEPTKLELLQIEYEKKKEEFKDDVKDTVLEKYGGEEYLKAPPKSLLLAQSEVYVEYARDGRIIKGLERPIIRSQYEEDVYINNHTSVFGSYWSNGQWGYKCCHSFIKNSYCVGETGKSSEHAMIKPAEPSNVEKDKDSDSEKEEKDDLEKVESEKSSSGSESSEDEEKSKKKSKNKKKDKKKSKKRKQKEKRREKKKRRQSIDKLEEALRAEEEHNMKVDQLMSVDERKRPYNSMYEVKAPTEAQMEAFMIKRAREDDPMLQFMSKK